jgi:multicomponent Na+:H+ antiporter subunit B
MSRRARTVLLAPALSGLTALVYWGLAGLPHFGDYRGPYGFIINRVATPERHMTNAVTAVVFDYRGFDTLGEEFILFAAVVGTVLLLRAQGMKPPTERDWIGSDAVRTFGVLFAGPALVVSLWLVAFGSVTPGGGFQGGVAVVGGFVLVYAAADYRSFRTIANEHVFDFGKGTGAGGYIVIGLAALVSGAPFLHNLLGPGETGTLVSGGSVPFINWSVALEVAAANLLLVREFLEHYDVPLKGGGR